MLRGLHKLCDKSRWAEVVEAVEAKRFDPNEKGGFGEWTPLHLACRRDPPLAVVSALLTAAPAAASTADIHGRHPLHLAAERGCVAGDDVLPALVAANPPSVAATDGEGMTPLHLALSASNRESRQKRPSPDATELGTLLGSGAGGGAKANDDDSTNPASKSDAGGNLPLHLLCDNIDDVTPESIALLVERYPAGVATSNADGHTPLHLAFLKAADGPPSIEAVEALLPDERADDVCSARDGDGLLVLHAACRNFAPFEVLQTLLAHHPRGAAEPFSAGRGGSDDEELYAIDVLESLRPTVLNEEELEDLNFKSDLLFAAHPHVLPYRLEEERMQRMVDLIVYEATEEDEDEEDAEGSAADASEKKLVGLSPSATSIWSFLCTFPEEDDPNELYYQTVKAIVDGLDDADTLRMLGNLPVDEERPDVPVRKCATPKIAALLNCTFRFVDRFEFDDADEAAIDVATAGGDVAALSSNKRDENVVHAGPTSLLIKAWDYGCPHEAAALADAQGPLSSSPKRTRVVIKLESDPSKFQRETQVQRLLPPSSASSGVVPILCSFDADRVSTEDETPGDAAFVRDRDLASQGRHEHLPRALDGFNHMYATILPLGDRNLNDVLAHEWIGDDNDASCGSSRADFVRECAGKMARSVALLHASKVVHCNLSLSSFVRLNGDLLLTGLEGAAPAGSDGRGYHPSSLLPVGTSSPSLNVGTLAPEMFADLDAVGALAYCTYWGSIFGDARADAVLKRSPECVPVIGAKIKTFLGTVDEWENVDALFGRYSAHADLWRKVAPRRVVGDDGEERFRVVRCARLDESTDLPFAPTTLPYALPSASEGADVWSLGLLLFKMLTGGRDFFPSTAGDNGTPSEEDFLKLASWSTEDAWNTTTSEDNLSAVSDPLARDLLRKLVVPIEDRITSVAEALGHMYFGGVTESEAVRIGAAIVKTETTRTEDATREKKEMAEWIKSRTTEVGGENGSPLSLDLQFRFLNSCDALWRSACADGDKKQASSSEDRLHPTGFTLLPYKLHASRGGTGSPVISSSADEERAQVMLSSVADALLYSSTSARLQSLDDANIESIKSQGRELLADFLSRGRDGYESKVVPICERILMRVEIAERILARLLDDLLGADGTGAALAKKLILETVESLVQYDRCADIVAKAREAERAFAVLFGGFVQGAAAAARTAVAENLAGEVFGGDFTKTLFHDAPKVDAALSQLLQAFVEDPIDAAGEMLQSSLEELVGAYGSADRLYFYLLDEGDGSPVPSSYVEVNKKKSKTDALRELLPALCLGMKSAFAQHSVRGLAAAFGLSADSLDKKRWLRTVRCGVGSSSDNSDLIFLAEHEAIQASVQAFYPLVRTQAPPETSAEMATDTLAYLEHFLEERDPYRNYGGLRRLTTADGGLGAVVWVSESQEAELTGKVAWAMEAFIEAKNREARALLGENDDDEEEGTAATDETPVAGRGAEQQHRSGGGGGGSSQGQHRRQTSTNASSVPTTRQEADVMDNETVTTMSTLDSNARTVIESFQELALTDETLMGANPNTKGTIGHVPASIVSKSKASLFGAQQQIPDGDAVMLTRSPAPATFGESMNVSPPSRRSRRNKPLWK